MQIRSPDQQSDIRVVLNAILEIYRKEYANDTSGGFFSQVINTSKNLGTKMIWKGITGAEKVDLCITIDNLFSTHLDSNNSIVNLCFELGKIGHKVATADKQQTRFTETIYALIHYIIYCANRGQEHSLANAFQDKREIIKKTMQNSIVNAHKLSFEDDEIDAIELQGISDKACGKHLLKLAFLGDDFQDFLGKVKFCFPEEAYSYTYSPLIPDVLNKNYLSYFLKKYRKDDLEHSANPIIEFEILARGKNTTNQTIVQARKAQQQDLATTSLKQSSSENLNAELAAASTPKILGGLQVSPSASISPPRSIKIEEILPDEKAALPTLSKSQKKKAKAKKNSEEETNAIGGSFEILAATASSPRPS